jgi:hypothetical protein
MLAGFPNLEGRAPANEANFVHQANHLAQVPRQHHPANIVEGDLAGIGLDDLSHRIDLVGVALFLFELFDDLSMTLS